MFEVGVIIWLLFGTISDLKYKRISKLYAYLSIVFGLFAGVMHMGEEWQGYAIGGCIGLFFFFIAKVTREQIGYGDAFVLTGLGFAIGIDAFMRLLAFSFFLVFLTSIFLLLFKKANRKTRLAYIPFLFLGYCVNIILERGV